jgi:menaquinone-dependent protoporphyrinogen IX oxidase
MKRRNFLKASLAAGLSTIAMADNAFALKYYPLPSEKKWAVLYGTWCGSSRDAGIWISEGMGGIADVFDVRENPELKGFDYIVVGGSIRAGKTRQELIDYMGKNQSWMKVKVRGLFAVCGYREGYMEQKKIDYLDNHIAKICGVGNVPSALFPGRITAALMEPEIREQMSQRAPMEDRDDLKRSDCMAFGKEVLASIQAT